MIMCTALLHVFDLSRVVSVHLHLAVPISLCFWRANMPRQSWYALRMPCLYVRAYAPSARPGKVHVHGLSGLQLKFDVWGQRCWSLLFPSFSVHSGWFFRLVALTNSFVWPHRCNYYYYWFDNLCLASGCHLESS